MKQSQGTFTVATLRRGNQDITRDIESWVERQGLATGLLTVFLQHVSAHLSMQEHADRDDLYTFFRRLEVLDEDFGEFTSAVNANQLTIPVQSGRMALGARQRIYLYEHRDGGHKRRLVLHLMGE
jgi:secondary thiamine-phosphate synthase enzyme